MLRRSSVRVAMTQGGGGEEGGVPTSSTDVSSSGSEDAAAKAAKLRSIAAELRAQVTTMGACILLLLYDASVVFPLLRCFL